MVRRTFSRFSRRRFLHGAGLTGLSGLGLPFVSSLVARADEDLDRPKRLIIFSSPNEPLDREHWLPPGNGQKFPLTSLRAEMESLEPYMDQLLLLGDMNMECRLADPHAGGHIGFCQMLVGRKVTSTGPGGQDIWGSGISVDQYIGQKLGMEPITLAIKPGGANGVGRMSYIGDSQPVTPITSPKVAFDNLFADAVLPTEERLRLKAQRLSVLDRVAGDLTTLQNRLPVEARHKLEVHTSMVRDLEMKLEADQVFDCDPTSPPEINYGSNANFPLTTRRQIDVMVQALGCGLTDIASVQLGGSGGGFTPVWPDEGINININVHNIAHNYNDTDGNNATFVDRREQTEAFLYRMFAYLLEQLRAVPEGDGTTMLDNSVVLWTKPLGWKHRHTKFLYMLAGGGRGHLNSGRFLSFPEVPHNNLLVSLCNLMGLSDESFGDPQFCTGPLDLS